MSDKPKQIPFSVDTTPYKIDESQNPVAVTYIRTLAKVGEEYDLYVRSRGQNSDRLLENNESIIIVPGMHFTTMKKVITNG